MYFLGFETKRNKSNNETETTRVFFLFLLKKDTSLGHLLNCTILHHLAPPCTTLHHQTLKWSKMVYIGLKWSKITFLSLHHQFPKLSKNTSHLSLHHLAPPCTTLHHLAPSHPKTAHNGPNSYCMATKHQYKSF